MFLTCALEWIIISLKLCIETLEEDNVWGEWLRVWLFGHG